LLKTFLGDCSSLNANALCMLDQLLKLVEQSAQQPIVQNKAIPDQFNNAAIKDVTQQILSTLKSEIANGNMQQIVGLFQTGGKSLNAHPVIGNINQSVINSLVSKFGINASLAQTIASEVVPNVIGQVIRKANDPKDIDFDLQQMMRSMSGNSGLDISGMLSQQPKGAIGNIGNVFGKLFGK